MQAGRPEVAAAELVTVGRQLVRLLDEFDDLGLPDDARPGGQGSAATGDDPAGHGPCFSEAREAAGRYQAALRSIAAHAGGAEGTTVELSPDGFWPMITSALEEVLNCLEQFTTRVAQAVAHYRHYCRPGAGRGELPEEAEEPGTSGETPGSSPARGPRPSSRPSLGRNDTGD